MKYTSMNPELALSIVLENEQYMGLTENDECIVTKLAENDFHVESVSKDPYDMFDFKVRIYIDPVFCAITYDIYESAVGDIEKFTLTDISYDHAE